VLRQRRYAYLAALMVAVAVGCVAAGTWQISRYKQTARDNHALDSNAHAPAVPFARIPVPLVGHGAAPGRDAIRFRTVTVSGTYIAAAQQLVRDQSLNGSNGFYVLDPLRTTGGVLLVVRGFVADNDDSTLPPTVGAPPTGTVRIAARLQTPSSGHDDAAQLGHGEVETVNPSEQAARLG
jgi:cytochrome oxidase assembly protein ShyY1